MFVEGLRNFYAQAFGTTTSAKGSKSTSDPTTLGIVFMAFACAVLPLDISQLAFAILGAVLYAFLQKSDQFAPEKKPAPAQMAFNALPCKYAAQAPKPKSSPTPASNFLKHSKPAPSTVLKQEVRAASVQPIVAPTFQGQDWESEVQELLLQIAPTAEVELTVKQLSRVMGQVIKKLIPEAEVRGFASGNLNAGRAFGVAVPEVDVVASVNPDVLFERLHGRSTQARPAEIDAKKLQKCAIRTCTDRLVSAGGFKFRRSAFRGQEPKVTLLAPASLGIFSDSIAIDFSVNVVTPLYNAALLTECGHIDGRAKELVLLVKRWAKDRGICHAAKGHLPPYLWGLLTIYFLQVRDEPLLPPLDQFEMSAGLLPEPRCGKTPKWNPPKSSEPRKSTASLFKEFMHFFQAEFDWNKEAVSVCTGKRAAPSLGLPLHIMVSEDSAKSQVGPSIEDPFQSAQNLADSMTAPSYARLKEEIARANDFCHRDASLSELLEPWVPADQESADAILEAESRIACATKADTKPNPQPASLPPWRRSATNA